MPPLRQKAIQAFKRTVKNYYKKEGRTLPWRGTENPYRILVSEIMLQQTQVARVLVKYPEFIDAFPNFTALARAPLKKVLRIWQGMGYNRRALALKKIAERVVNEWEGVLPRDPYVLETLPGIGPYTARAICAFAYNQPTVFLETNIRTVYIHFFLKNKKQVHDEEILALVEQTLDRKHPCLWYAILMDYGAMLKTGRVRLNSRSTHYRKQSTFKGSNRELRGKILKMLLEKSQTSDELRKALGARQDKLEKSICELIKEDLLTNQRKKLSIR